LRIPLSAPDVTEKDIAAVAAVLRTPHLSLGPKLDEFERQMAEYIGTRHAVAVSSGTAALHLCMRACRIGPGDEVIVPSFAFIAVANAVRYCSATPVFVDVEPETLNLDPAKIEAAITVRTRAIIVVHTFGVPAAMAEILAIARRRQVLVIEDACEAIGAEFQNRKAGAWGRAGVFGFYPNKQITLGEGGMIVTDDDEFAASARCLRNHGRAPGGDWLQHAELGYNYRISDSNCALGVEQLKRIDAILAARAAIAAAYHDRLAAHADVLQLPALRLPQCRLSWFVYVVRLQARFSAQERDDLVRKMAERGIACGRYFAPIHLQPAYQNAAGAWRAEDLQVTESQSLRTIALPFFNRLTADQVDEVCRTLCAMLR
jgi:perosamine synthetase